MAWLALPGSPKPSPKLRWGGCEHRGPAAPGRQLDLQEARVLLVEVTGLVPVLRDSAVESGAPISPGWGVLCLRFLPSPWSWGRTQCRASEGLAASSG